MKVYETAPDADTLLADARKKQFKKQLLEQLKPRVRTPGT